MSKWIKRNEPKSCKICGVKFVRGETIMLWTSLRKLEPREGIHPQCHHNRDVPIFYREDEWGKEFLCINRKFVRDDKK